MHFRVIVDNEHSNTTLNRISDLFLFFYLMLNTRDIIAFLKIEKSDFLSDKAP
jgi:hypothetical protein